MFPQGDISEDQYSIGKSEILFGLNENLDMRYRWKETSYLENGLKANFANPYRIPIFYFSTWTEFHQKGNGNVCSSILSHSNPGAKLRARLTWSTTKPTGQADFAAP
jgi:hypothetical protein